MCHHPIMVDPCMQLQCAQLAFLRKAAGAAAIPCPQIDLVNSFPAVIKAALGSRAGNSNFSPYDNDINFLLSAPSFLSKELS